MVYFIYGFKWSYEKESTFTFETSNFFSFQHEKNIDKFWEVLLIKISEILESYPRKLANINMSIAMFYSLIDNMGFSSVFFSELYKHLSSYSVNFYISLEKRTDIESFYNSFNDYPKELLRENIKIILPLAQANELENPLLINETELGLGIADYSKIEDSIPNFINTTQEEVDVDSYNFFLKEFSREKVGKSKHDYYRKNLYNKALGRNDWFKEGYVSYSTVLKCSSWLKILYPSDSCDYSKRREELFHCFGYNYSKNEGKLSADFKHFIKEKLKEKSKTRHEIVDSFIKYESKFSSQLKKYKKIGDGEDSWTESRISSLIDNHKIQKCRKIINRKLLFMLSFALELDIKETLKLFELCNCFLDKNGKYLIEDKILWDLLNPAFSIEWKRHCNELKKQKAPVPELIGLFTNMLSDFYNRTAKNSQVNQIW